MSNSCPVDDEQLEKQLVSGDLLCLWRTGADTLHPNESDDDFDVVHHI